MRNALVWSLLIVIGLIVGFVVAGLGAHPKAETAQIGGGIVVIATITVFVLALLRFILKNLHERHTNG